MFAYIQTIWCGFPFYLVWKCRSYTSCFITTPLVRLHLQWRLGVSGE